MDDEWPGGAEQERVAVGRALGDALGRHVAAGASHVLDHNRFAPGFDELVADHPRNGVGGTAGHKADQDAERLVGIARLRKCVACCQQRRQRGHDTDGLHRCSPVVSTHQPPRRTQRPRRRQDGTLWTSCYAAQSSMTSPAAEPAEGATLRPIASGYAQSESQSKVGLARRRWESRRDHRFARTSTFSPLRQPNQWDFSSLTSRCSASMCRRRCSQLPTR